MIPSPQAVPSFKPMNAPIFDSHAHYNEKRFDDDRAELLADLPRQGVAGVINAGTTAADSAQGQALAEAYDYIWFAAGIHPEELQDDTPESFQAVRALAAHPKCVAIGEIGLDYYWDKDHKEQQKDLFARQLILARELDLPVIIHDRDAHGDTMDLLRKYRPKGVLHCYSGSAEMAKEVLALGLYLGFTGVTTFPNSKKCREAIAIIPPERILVETDCPYMAPVPFRGRRCDSSMIPHTAAAIAQIKGMSPEEVLVQTNENVRRLFTKIRSL